MHWVTVTGYALALAIFVYLVASIKTARAVAMASGLEKRRMAVSCHEDKDEFVCIGEEKDHRLEDERLQGREREPGRRSSSLPFFDITVTGWPVSRGGACFLFSLALSPFSLLHSSHLVALLRLPTYFSSWVCLFLDNGAYMQAWYY